MRWIILIILELSFSGCTEMKYPGWEQVRILNEPPLDYECESLRNEDCTERDKPECPNWYKKRATIFHANTVIMRNTEYSHYAEYLKCHRPLTRLTFNSNKYLTGSNTVTGQAFLRQKGGDIVTCAGEKVVMIPNDLYFTANEDEYKKEPSSAANALIKTGQCDAQGNFEIDEIPDGEWIVSTAVKWDVPHFNYMGSASYYSMLPQGGIIQKIITVKTGKKNKIIISQ
jgi:hypothetical protein